MVHKRHVPPEISGNRTFTWSPIKSGTITTLKHYQQDLDEIVAERTIELNEVNVPLHRETEERQFLYHQLEMSQSRYQRLIAQPI